MPLEIKELHIRVNVENAASTSTGSSINSGASATAEPDPALVQACVEKVLEVLTKKTVR